MPKWIKFIIAILLLPFCAGAAKALWLVLRASYGADTVWVPLLAGAVCWIVIYALLPKPMWVYVFGHELTHVIWTWLFGGRVKKVKVTSEGGHVITSKTNFLIALAPYFFPLYAALVVAVFAIGHLIFGWKNYLVWFHLIVGAAYAFPCDVDLACAENTAVRRHVAGLFVFGGDYFSWQRGHIVVRCTVADGKSQFVQRAGLVAGKHRGDFSRAGAVVLKFFRRIC